MYNKTFLFNNPLVISSKHQISPSFRPQNYKTATTKKWYSADRQRGKCRLQPITRERRRKSSQDAPAAALFTQRAQSHTACHHPTGMQLHLMCFWQQESDGQFRGINQIWSNYGFVQSEPWKLICSIFVFAVTSQPVVSTTRAWVSWAAWGKDEGARRRRRRTWQISLHLLSEYSMSVIFRGESSGWESSS